MHHLAKALSAPDLDCPPPTARLWHTLPARQCHHRSPALGSSMLILPSHSDSPPFAGPSLKKLDQQQLRSMGGQGHTGLDPPNPTLVCLPSNRSHTQCLLASPE
ncbi:Filamin-A [Platysternon megacephalum]|uniref:Filamin-A n=1 Tax=Platysternon megacephalum TaxID=55544 RepID=A0A4D9DLP1_9SAUR|nr:Filamin-A [Platysternon megacephalum]